MRFGGGMQTVTDGEAKDRLGALLDDVAREPVMITRGGAAAAVLMGADEYAAIEETIHLFSTPANAKRIRNGLKDIEEGN